MSDKDDRHAFPGHHFTGEYDESTRKMLTEPHAGMSLRQYAAIHLRVPDSGTEWLNAMIRKARRAELAGKAMQAILGWPETPDEWIDITAQHAMKYAKAMEYADAMLKESDK